MLTIHETTLGNLATRSEAQAAISYLQGRGYAVTYGPHCPDAAKAIKPAHWRAAIKAAHQAAAQAEQMRDFAALTLAEQAALLAQVNCFLSDKIAEKLFAANMPLQPMPEHDEFLSAVMQEVEQVLNG